MGMGEPFLNYDAVIQAINFMMDKSYYEEGDIEDIRVEEICRYSRPIFKISV